jgi:hypothetical protein
MMSRLIDVGTPNHVVIAPETLISAIILAAGISGGGVKLTADKLAAWNVAQWHLLHCFNFHIGITPG